MINSINRSLVSGKKWYRNISAGNPLYSEMELISTVLVGSGGTTSISFDVTGLGSSYKHLQIRASVDASNDINFRFNNSSTSNTYAYHYFYANISGGTVTSGATANSDRGYVGYAATSAQAQAGCIVDFIDPFNTNKNRTVRSFMGNAPDTANSRFVMLNSTVWMSTAALTSIQFFNSSSSIGAGSRVSLYGIKG